MSEDTPRDELAKAAWRHKPEHDDAPCDVWWDGPQDTWLDGYSTGWDALLEQLERPDIIEAAAKATLVLSSADSADNQSPAQRRRDVVRRALSEVVRILSTQETK